MTNYSGIRTASLLLLLGMGCSSEVSEPTAAAEVVLDVDYGNGESRQVRLHSTNDSDRLVGTETWTTTAGVRELAVTYPASLLNLPAQIERSDDGDFLPLLGDRGRLVEEQSTEEHYLARFEFPAGERIRYEMRGEVPHWIYLAAALAAGVIACGYLTNEAIDACARQRGCWAGRQGWALCSGSCTPARYCH